VNQCREHQWARILGMVGGMVNGVDGEDEDDNLHLFINLCSLL
jgi:hypothetical protein